MSKTGRGSPRAAIVLPFDIGAVIACLALTQIWCRGSKPQLQGVSHVAALSQGESLVSVWNVLHELGLFVS